VHRSDAEPAATLSSFASPSPGFPTAAFIDSQSSFSNSGSKQSTIACGSGQSASSVISPNCTPPPYERMLTPTPMSPEAGTQNIVCFKVAPQNCSGTPGPGHVGHDRGRLLAEEAEDDVLQRLGELAGDREHGESEQRLVARLERVHARAHRVDAGHRVGDADRQHQRRQAEAVAELPGLVESAAGSPAPSRGSPCLRVVALHAQPVADGPETKQAARR
jgi:hypothetical protein